MEDVILTRIKRGSAELAILSVLAGNPMHGYEIAKRIEDGTSGALKFQLASLYPMLYALEGRGLVKGTWETVASGRRRRRYRLTAAGKKQLQPLKREWERLFAALNRLAGVRQHG